LERFLPENEDPVRENEELISFLIEVYLDHFRFDTAREAASLKRRLDAFIGRTQRLGSPVEMYTEIVQDKDDFIVVLHHLGMNGWKPQNGPLWGVEHKEWNDGEDDNYLPPPTFQ
jgi:hypothetical protein